MLKATAKRHNLEFEQITQSSNYSAAAFSLRDSQYCVIWHGHSPFATWAKETRKAMGLPFCIAECGWFRQGDYWHFDSKGLIGESSLCGELPEPSVESLALLEKKQIEYELADATYPPPRVPEGAVLVPMQLPRDVAIYAFAPFRTNSDWTDHVLARFPDRPIVFKTHPKAHQLKIDGRGRKDVFVVRDGSFTALARQAALVYGQTSNTLCEAALVGASVEVVGNTPLRYHANNPTRLLAAMCKRQIRRDEVDVWNQLEEAHSCASSG